VVDRGKFGDAEVDAAMDLSNRRKPREPDVGFSLRSAN